jgi:hypothetical protein
MGQSISSIRDFIGIDVGRGKEIDVDAYCRSFAPLFPHLTRKQIRQEIIGIVCELGGGTVRSMNDALPLDEPGDEGDLDLSR